MTRSRGRAGFGILVPFTNSNLAPDMALLRPLGAANLDEPLRLVMGVKPDVIIYGCISATVTHGPAFDRGLAERIKTFSGAKTVTAAGALVHALEILGVSRVGFASHCMPEVNDLAIGFLAETGVETVVRSEVGNELGKPVISSNQAMAFGANELAGISETLPGYGLLLERTQL